MVPILLRYGASSRRMRVVFLFIEDQLDIFAG